MRSILMNHTTGQATASVRCSCAQPARYYNILADVFLCQNCGLTTSSTARSHALNSAINSGATTGTSPKQSQPTTQAPPQPATPPTSSVSSPNTTASSAPTTEKESSEYEIGQIVQTVLGFSVEITGKQTVYNYTPSGRLVCEPLYWAKPTDSPGLVSQPYNAVDLVGPKQSAWKPKVCECGADKVGSVFHSKWCPKYKEIA